MLRPTLDKLETDSNDNFARRMLALPGGHDVSIKRVEDVLQSDRHFAMFLNVIGPFLVDASTPINRAIPCAAIVGHPTLLDATASVCGSTSDNFVLRSDCAETLPPTPALTALDARIDKNWPSCDGTIRFAAYRKYMVALDAVRLGFTTHDPKARLGRLDHVAPADIAAARAELCAYYARYLGKAKPQANAMAADAITAILATGQQCE